MDRFLAATVSSPNLPLLHAKKRIQRREEREVKMKMKMVLVLEISTLPTMSLPCVSFIRASPPLMCAYGSRVIGDSKSVLYCTVTQDPKGLVVFAHAR